MGIIDQLKAFSDNLSEADREAFEEALAALMASHGHGNDLSGEQMAELQRRIDDRNPRYATDDEVSGIFGKNFGE